MQEFAGKVAVITGGASGIGLGMATRFAAEGMRLVLADIEEAVLEEAAAGLRENGAEVLTVQTDCGDAASMDNLAEESLAHYGSVHVVCNNAGVGARGTMWKLGVNDWEFVLRVNLWGVIHGVRVFAPHLVEQDEGHIVNTGSMAGLVSVSGTGPYNVSKHGVVTLSETLYGELQDAGSNVGVSVLCPGIIRTNLRNSERNRPEHLRDLDAEAVKERTQSTPGFSDTVRLQALSPEWAAECVFEGIKENRFYILTHDDHEGQIPRRHDAIQNDGNPAVVRSTVFAGGPIER
ncbi:MAG: SDR family NAD(P)-dependent oxidoreductase [Dehalococcoidia bacterium]|nr:SDR family NAD(P)-dependent oxidoreductase [Dehalococcoidia bacterium]